MPMPPAVAYLSRWSNRDWARPFLTSLAENAAGAAYDLVLVLKGYPEGAVVSGLESLRAAIGVPVTELRISDEGYGINAYRAVARHCTQERVLFLTSYSRILAPNWMASYLSAFDTVPNCGIVGATGTYETIPGMNFPNINIRTNAFMMARALFLSLDFGELKTKGDNNQFEAGDRSLTRQIMERGLEPVVIDRAGKAWFAREWPQSRTFRVSHQEGLLIADNRTHHYAAGSAAKRTKLARLAWGEAVTPPRLPLTRRLANELTWRWPRLGSYHRMG